MANVNHHDPLRGTAGVLIVPSAPRPRDTAARANAHGTVIIGAFCLMLTTIAVSFMDQSPLAAVVTLLGAPIVLGILAVAWMRPTGASPEHHPSVDRVLDDTAP